MTDLVGTVAEVARRLGVCEDIVRDLIREGHLPHVRLSARKTVVPWAALDRWLLTKAEESTR
jgi:excisionase family DNA binding protein